MMRTSRGRTRRSIVGRIALIATMAMMGSAMTAPAHAQSRSRQGAKSSQTNKWAKAQNKAVSQQRASRTTPRPVRTTQRPVARDRRIVSRMPERIRTPNRRRDDRGSARDRTTDRTPDRGRSAPSSGRDRDKVNSDRWHRDLDKARRLDRQRRARSQTTRRSRRPDYRSGSHGHRGPRIGFTINVLPRHYTRHHVHGIYFYYSSGSFYRRYGSSYRVVIAPYGARLRYLPAGYEIIWVDGSRVFYYDGVFYRYDSWYGGYVVIEAPYGVEVEFLPDDYEEVWFEDEMYYHSRGVHYRPVVRSGLTFYLTVRL